MVTIAHQARDLGGRVALAERHPEVVCAVGVHPHEAGKEGLDDPAPLLEAARHPKVVGIGESGLDYFYDLAPARPAGGELPHPHRAPRARTGLPLIVHTRDADEDTMAILEEEMAAGAVHAASSTATARAAAWPSGPWRSASISASAAS